MNWLDYYQREHDALLAWIQPHQHVYRADILRMVALCACGGESDLTSALIRRGRFHE